MAVRGTLGKSGFGDIPVGTVDKFQGQEDPIDVDSVAGSSPQDVPRGIDFGSA
jgi:uncharacterized protein